MMEVIFIMASGYVCGRLIEEMWRWLSQSSQEDNSASPKERRGKK